MNNLQASLKRFKMLEPIFLWTPRLVSRALSRCPRARPQSPPTYLCTHNGRKHSTWVWMPQRNAWSVKVFGVEGVLTWHPFGERVLTWPPFTEREGGPEEGEETQLGPILYPRKKTKLPEEELDRWLTRRADEVVPIRATLDLRLKFAAHGWLWECKAGLQ